MARHTHVFQELGITRGQYTGLLPLLVRHGVSSLFIMPEQDAAAAAAAAAGDGGSRGGGGVVEVSWGGWGGRWLVGCGLLLLLLLLLLFVSSAPSCKLRVCGVFGFSTTTSDSEQLSNFLIAKYCYSVGLLPFVHLC